MFSYSVLLLALLASAQGRAVNISNTWVLPEEGFPVFYRYFRDRISWYEADAVCQFHHANLVTVDTTAQYDAVRAYLKELDISSAVWVGLIRSNPDGDFTWTDYRGLSGDGYWSAAPDARAAPLCAAADPASDYRWGARACGGPTVASFICELPVPQWALGNQGCMVRELPALTILYLPESAAVQLTADCGLAGVKRVQCTGSVKRENLLKDLSCIEEDELTTTPVIATEESSTLSQEQMTDSTDTESVTELTAEDDITTKLTSESDSLSTTHATPVPVIIKEKLFAEKPVLANKLNNDYSKNVNLDLLHNNNLQSNDIPKLGNNDIFLTIEQSEKLEDEKHMHHKMLHDELARLGNFETIFTQPTDHFVPPLVMAKAKISDDMTVLSLAEKHAQQMAEQQRYVKHNTLNEHNYLKLSVKLTTEKSNKIELTEKPFVMTLQPFVSKESLKKDKVKSALPKKYKYDDMKAKNFKRDGKLPKFEKSTEKSSTPIDITSKIPEITTTQITEPTKTMSEDNSLELTVILKEPKITNMTQSDDIAKFENIVKTTESFPVTKVAASTETALKISLIDVVSATEKTEEYTTENSLDGKPDVTQKSGEMSSTGIPNTKLNTTDLPVNTDAIMQDVVMNHEVIKITIVDDNDKTNPTHTIFEVTTLIPEFKDDVNYDNKTGQTPKLQTRTNTKDINLSSSATTSIPITVMHQNETVTSTEISVNHVTGNIKTTEGSPYEEIKIISTELPLTTKTDVTTLRFTVNESTNGEIHNDNGSVSTLSVAQTTEKVKLEVVDISEIYEIDPEHNSTDPDAIDDINSPLLSAASEPIHRPNRSRRPIQNKPKFNPIRILG